MVHTEELKLKVAMFMLVKRKHNMGNLGYTYLVYSFKFKENDISLLVALFCSGVESLEMFYVSFSVIELVTYDFLAFLTRAGFSVVSERSGLSPFFM